VVVRADLHRPPPVLPTVASAVARPSFNVTVPGSVTTSPGTNSPVIGARGIRRVTVAGPRTCIHASVPSIFIYLSYVPRLDTILHVRVLVSWKFVYPGRRSVAPHGSSPLRKPPASRRQPQHPTRQRWRATSAMIVGALVATRVPGGVHGSETGPLRNANGPREPTTSGSTSTRPRSDYAGSDQY
jgi:hypothetical protein